MKLPFVHKILLLKLPRISEIIRQRRNHFFFFKRNIQILPDIVLCHNMKTSTMDTQTFFITRDCSQRNGYGGVEISAMVVFTIRFLTDGSTDELACSHMVIQVRKVHLGRYDDFREPTLIHIGIVFKK